MEYSLKFSTDAAGIVSSAIDMQSSDTRVEQFTSNVFVWNELVKPLDRHDSFSKLIIPSGVYELIDEETFGFGIKPNNSIHHGGATVLPHQQTAALKFLKLLRGFGLLADIVGSGKTFEAGIALSELAARDRISSVLFIVPEQVYSDWVFTMEKCFGMGENSLIGIGKNILNFKNGCKRANGFLIPQRPAIVTKESFVQWKPEDIKDMLFDMIVVDEAHFLNDTADDNANAMYLLSLLMETKNKASERNLTRGQYCLLLSATPHNGNLEDMFRLWYFIRFNGGNPEDFRPGQTHHTDKFNREKEFYLNTICAKATTIEDFVRKKKITYLCGVDANNRVGTGNAKLAFERYIQKNGIRIAEFDAKTESEKENIINAFLDEDGNGEHREAVLEAVANDYHEDVLRTIMVRQPKDDVNVSNVKKKAVNLFYFKSDDNRTDSDVKVWEGISGMNRAESFSVDLCKDEVSILHSSTFRPYGSDGRPKRRPDGTAIALSLQDFVNDICRTPIYNNSQNKVYAKILENILSSFGLSDVADANNQTANFRKKGSLSFFRDMVMAADTNIGSDRCNVEYSLEPIKSSTSDFDHKYGQLCKILRKHKNERVIVFFDYTLNAESSMREIMYNRVCGNEEFCGRVIDSVTNSKEKVEQIFKNKDDAILLATNESYTEGANLQSCHVIVNLEIPANPLAMQQRIGRVCRIGQKEDITIYSIANLFELEGYLLSYYTRIGLINGNNGDAEILAGCNNENMIAVQCEKCEAVKLITKEEFRALNNQKCPNPACGKHGTLHQIITRSYRCNNKHCSVVIERNRNSNMYHCVGGNGILTQDAASQSTYTCSKICLLSHCSRFNGPNRRVTSCPALEEYRRTNSPSYLEVFCSGCQNKDECSSLGCSPGRGIASCINCGESTFSCQSAPMVLKFDDKLEAECPVCRKEGRRGKISPLKNSSFESFICELYNFDMDGGESFCDTFKKEIRKVGYVCDILRIGPKQYKQED